MEGLALLKMQSFRCFQIIQGVRSAREVSPFLIAAGVFVLASAHQSNKEGSVEGGAQVMRAQASTSCQTCLEKGHLMMRWSMDSIA
jgi:hypothetical protein